MDNGFSDRAFSRRARYARTFSGVRENSPVAVAGPGKSPWWGSGGKASVFLKKLCYFEHQKRLQESY